MLRLDDFLAVESTPDRCAPPVGQPGSPLPLRGQNTPQNKGFSGPSEGSPAPSKWKLTLGMQDVPTDANGRAAEEFPRLSKAPIHEAVIDFRLSVPKEEVRSELAELAKTLSSEYPIVEEQTSFEGALKVGPGQQKWESHGGSFMAFKLRCPDRRRVVQLRTVGFTLSHYRPYDSWDAMFQEAWQLWERYVAAAAPEEVGRVATRFINRLELPANFDTADYFTTDVSTPDGLPDVVTAFNYFYVMQVAPLTLANVRLATNPSETEEQALVVLDIDCYTRGSFAPNSRELPVELGKLRTLKNQVFFRTLTPMALELYR